MSTSRGSWPLTVRTAGWDLSRPRQTELQAAVTPPTAGRSRGEGASAHASPGSPLTPLPGPAPWGAGLQGSCRLPGLRRRGQASSALLPSPLASGFCPHPRPSVASAWWPGVPLWSGGDGQSRARSCTRRPRSPGGTTPAPRCISRLPENPEAFPAPGDCPRGSPTPKALRGTEECLPAQKPGAAMPVTHSHNTNSTLGGCPPGLRNSRAEPWKNLTHWD